MRTTLSLLLFAIIVIATPLRADHAAAIDAALAKLPAPDAAAEAEVSGALLALGADGLGELLARIAPPGPKDDSAVRFAIDGLNSHVSRPGQAEARATWEKALLAALAAAKEPHVKSYLLEAIARVGGAASVEAANGYLGDDLLRPYALRVLLTIRTPDVHAKLLAALGSVGGTDRVTIIDGLGGLHVAAAIAPLKDLVRDEDAETRYAAWTALGKIGDPLSFPSHELIGAMKSSAVRERAAATNAYLEFSRSFARRGEASTGVGLLRNLISRSLGSSPHDACAALSVLAEIGSDDEVLGELTSAMAHGGTELRAVALRLARERPGEGVTKRFGELLEKGKQDPAYCAQILDMLGRRGDAAALPAIRKTLANDDVDVRFAAIRAAARIEGKPAVPVLVAAIESAKGAERAALIALTPRLGGRVALDAVAKETTSKDEAVSGAAISTLLDWPEGAAIAPILALGRANADVRGAAVSNAIRLALASRYPREETLAIYRDALDVAQAAAEKRVVIEALGGLKMPESVEILAKLQADETLRGDAAAALVRCALPRKSGQGGLSGAAVAKAIEAALPNVADAELAAQGKEYLATLEGE